MNKINMHWRLNAIISVPMRLKKTRDILILELCLNVKLLLGNGSQDLTCEDLRDKQS